MADLAVNHRLVGRPDSFRLQHNYSGLVIDANRPTEAPDLIVSCSQNTTFACNRNHSDAERQQRIETLFELYHRPISTELDGRTRRASLTVLVSLNSFTPVHGGVVRPRDVGVLYGLRCQDLMADRGRAAGVGRAACRPAGDLAGAGVPATP